MSLQPHHKEFLAKLNILLAENNVTLTADRDTGGIAIVMDGEEIGSPIELPCGYEPPKLIIPEGSLGPVEPCPLEVPGPPLKFHESPQRGWTISERQPKGQLTVVPVEGRQDYARLVDEAGEVWGQVNLKAVVRGHL